MPNGAANNNMVPKAFLSHLTTAGRVFGRGQREKIKCFWKNKLLLRQKQKNRSKNMKEMDLNGFLLKNKARWRKSCGEPGSPLYVRVRL